MNRISFIGPIEYQQIFKDHIEDIVKRIIPNYADVIAGWTIWLGTKPPTSTGYNENRPHTDPNYKNIFIPIFNVIPDSDRDEIGEMLVAFHEAWGHVVHLTHDIDWEEWSRETGHLLQLEETMGANNYWNRPSWESFAKDMDSMIQSRDPRPYYMRILGLEYVHLKVNDMTIDANGVIKQMDVAPVILGNRTLTPPRHTHEVFGDSVDYKDDTQAVLIVRVKSKNN